MMPGLAPFLGGADVDDGHPAPHEPLERGVVDLGDVRPKRCAACEEGGDEEQQSRHCEIRHESVQSRRLDKSRMFFAGDDGHG